MWGRTIEIMTAVWLAFSPFILGSEDVAHLILVDSLVALLVRIATGTTASLVAVLALLLRIVTGLSRRLRRITERLEALEGAKASDPSAEAPGRLETGRA